MESNEAPTRWHDTDCNEKLSTCFHGTVPAGIKKEIQLNVHRPQKTERQDTIIQRFVATGSTDGGRLGWNSYGICNTKLTSLL